MSVHDLFIIDLDKLEKHWQEQPELVREWGERLANARLEYEQAQVELERVWARLDFQVRQNPDAYFSGKPTEKAIDSIIKSDAEIKALQDKIVDIKYKMERLKVIVQALDHRKTALENLVKLHGQEYFALPNVKKIDLVQVDKKIARAKIAKKLNKKGE